MLIASRHHSLDRTLDYIQTRELGRSMHPHSLLPRCGHYMLSSCKALPPQLPCHEKGPGTMKHSKAFLSEDACQSILSQTRKRNEGCQGSIGKFICLYSARPFFICVLICRPKLLPHMRPLPLENLKSP